MRTNIIKVRNISVDFWEDKITCRGIPLFYITKIRRICLVYSCVQLK